MQISQAGLAFTKQCEGFRAQAYQDSGGIWTIGYGHTGPYVRPLQVITEAQGEALLRSDMESAVACVNEYVKVPLSQFQFDALCDFTFNVGRASFLHSTLLTRLNAGEYADAATQFGRWIYASGEIAAGLVARRKAETAMFNT